MIEYSAKIPAVPNPFHKLLKVVALLDDKSPQVRALIERLAAEKFEVEISDHYDQDVYEALVANEVDFVPLDEGVKNRISATLALIYPPGIGVVVPGDKRAQPMLDYFLTFEESFNRFPGFNYEVQGVFQ